jgi:hypothetical protein
MGVATVLTVLIVPVFFRVFQAVGERYFGEGAAPVEGRLPRGEQTRLHREF